LLLLLLFFLFFRYNGIQIFITKIKKKKKKKKKKKAMKIVNKKLRRRFYYRMTLNQHHDAVNPYMEKIKREIAILKKCSHPHVVKLKEVIDSPESEKIYISKYYLFIY